MKVIRSNKRSGSVRQLFNVIVSIAIFLTCSMLATLYAQQSPQQRTIIRDITPNSINSLVTIYGKIDRIDPIQDTSSPIIINIFDGTGTIRLSMSRDILAKISDPGKFKVKEMVWARGIVQKYQDTVEIKLQSPTDLILASESSPRQVAPRPARTPSPPMYQARVTAQSTQVITPPPVGMTSQPAQSPVYTNQQSTMPFENLSPQSQTPQQPSRDMPAQTTPGNSRITPINAITLDNEGTKVTIQGTVTKFRTSWKLAAPNIATITDATGTIDVVYWKQVNDQLAPDHKPQVGKSFKVTAFVDQFRSQAQLRVETPDSIVPIKIDTPPNR